MSTKADQTDILALNEQLTAQIATLTTERDTFKAQAAEATKGSETLSTTLGIRTKERDDLKAENETLKAGQADFNKRLATELSKQGIRGQAVEHKEPAARKLTATEKCLAAKGLPLDTPVTL
jgi:hypothetical protein